MSEIRLDPNMNRYAQRTRGMTASEIRALFAVASRPEVVSLAGGMPYVGALDHEAVAEVARSVIADQGDVALQYGGGQGHAGLREQLVGVMAEEQVPAHPDDLVITTGGQQGLDLIAKLFIDPGDVILAEGPSYVGAISAFTAYEADVRHVAMDEDGLIPESLRARLAELAAAERPVKFLYTVPNHQNPAGSSLSVKRREEIADICAAQDLLILEDNPYGLLDFKGEIRTSFRELAPERTIYLGTLSKIFSSGIRVGWVVANGAIRDKLVQLKEGADLCQSNLTQLIAERWLATEPWQEQVDTFREVYRERCDAMLAELDVEMPPGASWTAPTGGFFVWLAMPEGIDARELLAKALQARVAYVPGGAFYADNGGVRHARLSFCFPPADRIREGVRRLGKVLRAEMELRTAIYGS